MAKFDGTRIADFILATIFISWVLPLWIIVIPILRFTGEGEVFFRQPRVGKDGKLFDLLKFATMLKNSPNIGTGELTLHNDARVLPVGRWLRKSKINELPQLINVWLGHMSIVGPRPQTPRCFAAYAEEIQRELSKVRPGLSGMGPILFRGEEKMMKDVADPVAFYDQVIMPYKGEVERWYIENHTARNYFLIIIATIWIILFPKSRVAWQWFRGLPTPPAELAPYF
jgi:lipopolysaccharide/colanic/teichoic acid biosynthesis glycosyltransferase